MRQKHVKRSQFGTTTVTPQTNHRWDCTTRERFQNPSVTSHFWYLAESTVKPLKLWLGVRCGELCAYNPRHVAFKRFLAT